MNGPGWKHSLVLITFLLVCTVVLHGQTPADLTAWLNEHEVRASVDPLLGLYTLDGRAGTLQLATGRTWAILDGMDKVDLPGLSWVQGNPVFTKAGLESLTGMLDPPPPLADGSDRRITTIIIDPGHGGKDPGSIGKKGTGSAQATLREKDVTLAISLQLRDMLQKTYPGIKIMLTRDNDTFISLDDRTKKANLQARSKDQSVLFISIHANASLSSKAKGYEVWYLPPQTRRKIVRPGDYEVDESVLEVINDLKEEELSTDGYLLAASIQKHMGLAVGDLSPNRGLKEEEWYVVRNSFMPSVLVELGFVTNPDEFVLLSSPAYLKKLSQGIYSGIVAFVGDYQS